MPPRVALWSTSLAFGMEGVANEVWALHRNLPGSIVWGVDSRTRFITVRRRLFATSPGLQLVFRLYSSLFQGRYEIQHLYGGLGDWFHLRALRRAPALLTIALDGQPVQRSLLAKIDRFAVEWPSAVETLTALGVSPERIDLVLPPVDLDRFCAAPPPAADRFTATFASSPESPEALAGRGIPLMLAAADLRPNMSLTLKWRPWGRALHRVTDEIAARKLTNVTVDTSRSPDMASTYQAAHVTLACYLDRRHCKPMPNSILESLACGRPAIVTRQVELAPLIERARAGVVIDPDPGELARALDAVRDDWPAYSKAARRLAEERFCQRRFVAQYLAIYKRMLG